MPTRSIVTIAVMAGAALATAALTDPILGRAHEVGYINDGKPWNREMLPVENTISFLAPLYADPKQGNRKQRRAAGKKKKHFNHSNPNNYRHGARY